MHEQLFNSAHRRAFLVVKAMPRFKLNRMRRAVRRAIQRGERLDDFWRRQMPPRGWAVKSAAKTRSATQSALLRRFHQLFRAVLSRRQGC